MINLPLPEDIPRIKAIPGIVACVFDSDCVYLLCEEINNIDFGALVDLEDELDLFCSIRALQGRSVEDKFGKFIERLF
jgi:hypothetical protein